MRGGGGGGGMNCPNQQIYTGFSLFLIASEAKGSRLAGSPLLSEAPPRPRASSRHLQRVSSLDE